ncbi:MAG: tetratricopeptide repeat protein [Steroidobacteraceae bacterium]|jgi:hypothetical protein
MVSSSRRFAAFLLSVALLSLAACSDLQEWRSTQRADTIESYEAFLEQYPESQYAPVAQRRLADLIEQRDWLAASEADTAEAYRDFINSHPKGRWVREARVRLQNFLSTPGVLGPAAIEPIEPIEPAPPPAMLPAEPAKPPIDAAPERTAPAATATLRPVEHRIQLGAFSSRDKALEGWRNARERHPELQGLVSQVVVGAGASGRLHRLQASVVSEVRAREICRALVKSGQACVYVPPER